MISGTVRWKVSVLHIFLFFREKFVKTFRREKDSEFSDDFFFWDRESRRV